MRLSLAIRAFCAVLYDSRVASDVEALLRGEKPELPEADTTTEVSHPPPEPACNDAITLLATLQREARFLDIVKEPLGDYSDEQIGAAARDVLRDCDTVLDRLFAIRPLVEDAEGAELATPANYDAGRYRLIGNVSGSPPFQGKLVHHGWHATRCELPNRSASEQSAMVVAPVELEIP